MSGELKTAMQIRNHCLTDARQVCSPNFNARPEGIPISLLVVHCISLPPGEFGSDCIDRFFQNCLPADEHDFFKEIEGLQVSAHLLIRRDGELVQYVPFDQRAWHAGQSCFDGCENCNDFSIGIELEGTDETPYEPAQYQALAAVTRCLMQEYPDIREHCIVGHSDIAPGRKTDPGPCFDWTHFKSLLNLQSTGNSGTA